MAHDGALCGEIVDAFVKFGFRWLGQAALEPDLGGIDPPRAEDPPGRGTAIVTVPIVLTGVATFQPAVAPLALENLVCVVTLGLVCLALMRRGHRGAGATSP